MNEKLPPIRRVVTVNDASGKSRIAEDGPAPAIRTVAERPGYRAVNVWRTQEMPARIDAADTTREHKGVLPPKIGTILRICDFPPEPKDPKELKRVMDATFGSIYTDANHERATARHPGMHKTETVDYGIVLEGEIWAVMEEGETLLRTGDIMIQRGTNHAWSNRSSKTCRIAFVLIDGVY
jgi:hypothetical protein